MKKAFALLSALALLLAGCDKKGSVDYLKALTVQASGQNEPFIIMQVGSVFHLQTTIDPNQGSSLNCFFLRDNKTEWPTSAAWQLDPFVEITGFVYRENEYTEPGQCINRIVIRDMDVSAGLGSTIEIPMEQGEYKGGNTLVKCVKIHSFKLSTYNDDYSQNVDSVDANIHITITTVKGDIITIRFTGDVTRPAMMG